MRAMWRGCARISRMHPNLTRKRVVFEGGNYFRNPSLLEFVAENPVRHGKLPKNIVEVTKVILDAGVEPVFAERDADAGGDRQRAARMRCADPADRSALRPRSGSGQRCRGGGRALRNAGG